MSKITEICRKLEAAQYERRVAQGRCNVVAAEYQTQLILRLSTELQQLRNQRDTFVRNRMLPYFAANNI